MATQASDTANNTASKRARGASPDDLSVIAQRAQAFTNASGVAIALSEGNADEIVCRARSGNSFRPRRRAPACRCRRAVPPGHPAARAASRSRGAAAARSIGRARPTISPARTRFGAHGNGRSIVGHAFQRSRELSLDDDVRRFVSSVCSSANVASE